MCDEVEVCNNSELKDCLVGSQHTVAAEGKLCPQSLRIYNRIPSELISWMKEPEVLCIPYTILYYDRILFLPFFHSGDFSSTQSQTEFKSVHGAVLQEWIITHMNQVAALHGTCCIVFSRANHWKLAWARWSQFTSSLYNCLNIHLNIILIPTPRSCEWFLLFRYFDQKCVCISHLSCVCCISLRHIIFIFFTLLIFGKK